MSEFGNETATAVFKLSEKSMDALLKLLKFLMERNERAVNNNLKKEQLKSIKDQKQKQKAIAYLDKNRGYARMKQMLKSGERLIPIGTALSPREQKRFNHYAKISGLTYSSISDKRVAEKIKLIKEDLKDLEAKAEIQTKIGNFGKSLNLAKLSEADRLKYESLTKEMAKLEEQRANRILIVRDKDLELVKDITDRMNMDIRFEDIETEINDIKDKGSISKEDEQRIKDLEKKKSDLENASFEKFNDRSNDTILAEAMGDEVHEKVDFDKALLKVTGRMDKEACIVCERTNPRNYMEVSSTQEISDEGNPYVNTEYKVYNQGEQQKCDEFKHGKFTHYSDSKGNNTSSYGNKHWENMKKEMKQKGGFTNDLLMFKHKEDYEKYVEQYQKAVEKTTPREDTIAYEADGNSFKDCMGIINRLQGQLSDHNLALNSQRELCNATTKNVIHYDKNMEDDERLAYVSGKNMVSRIENLEKMNDIQNKIAFVENDKQTDMQQFAKYGRPEVMLDNHKSIQAEYDRQIEELKQQHKETLAREEQLATRQKAIESITIVSLVTQEALESEMVEAQTRQAETNSVELKETLHSDVEEMQNETTQSKEQWQKDISNNRETRTLETTRTANVKTTEHTRE